MPEAKTATSGRKFVEWTAKNHFEVRKLTEADWKKLGAVNAPKETVWNKENGWRVPREAIPLTDQQLSDYLARDPLFKVVEA